MLITQKFHALKEIDPEFVAALEVLMQEYSQNFKAWVEREEKTPPDVTFNYWLFFGPTQNSPIGIAQVMLKKVNADNYLPWWKMITGMFDKNKNFWKEAVWKIDQGQDGAALFDPRYLRSGKEKLLELLKEVNARQDVVKVEMHLPESYPTLKPDWPEVFNETHSNYLVLKSYQRTHRNYQDYLEDLGAQKAQTLKAAWKDLHKQLKVKLGDYPTPESRKELLARHPKFDPTLILDFKGGLLSFEQDQDVLGLVHYYHGVEGVLFIEPAPFESSVQPLVNDELYIQYGLLKAHEMEQVKKIVILQKSNAMILPDDEVAQEFKSQGFQIQKIKVSSWCKTPYYQ
jgi:hypothetical protein